ncbi:MAG TPA: flavin reductase family protein [Longimicrobiales bacterium]
MGKQPIQGTIHTHEADPLDEAQRLGAQLRQAMAGWPTGVAILAVRHRARIEALTVNSFISVSLTPPLILVSIAQTAQILPLLNEAGRFTISVLAADQARIASQVADRMPGLQRSFTDEEQPVVRDSVAHLFCTTSQTEPAGDHILYVAAVTQVRLGRNAASLLYVNGKYGHP